MRAPFPSIVATVLLLCGCVDTNRPGGEGESPVRVLPSDLAPIPNDVSFTTLEDETLHDIKRMVSLEMHQKVSEEILRSLAYKIRDSEPVEYERTFITYTLPGMTPDAGCWATTHFDPDLEVVILGLSLEDEQRLLDRLEADPPANVVGVWVDDYPGFPCVTLIRRGPEVVMERYHPDGSSGGDVVSATRTAWGVKFVKVGTDNLFGDHYLLTDSGELEARDDDGFIKTLRPVQVPGVRLIPRTDLLPARWPTVRNPEPTPEPEPLPPPPPPSNRDRVRTLLEQLDVMKGTPEFAQNAFGRGGVGAAWMEEARKLRIELADSPSAVRALRELTQLALEYAMTDGAENTSTQAKRAEVEQYLGNR